MAWKSLVLLHSPRSDNIEFLLNAADGTQHVLFGSADTVRSFGSYSSSVKHEKLYQQVHDAAPTASSTLKGWPLVGVSCVSRIGISSEA